MTSILSSETHFQRPQLLLRHSSTNSIKPISTANTTPIPSRPNSDGVKGEEDELHDDVSTPQQELPNGLLPSSCSAPMKAAPVTAIASGSGLGTASTPSPRGGIYSNGSSKSRKSSCEVCHQRKIKCDQQRPSCSSCVRKNHTCRYAEEAEPNHPLSVPRLNQHQRAMSVTIVNATDPTIKHTISVPGNGNSAPSTTATSTMTTPSLKVGYGQNHVNAPEWKVENSPSINGIGEKKKAAERRERILNGFDSEDEDDNEADGKGSVKGKNKDKTIDLDGELAALADDKQEEVDELEDDDQDGSVESEEKDRKRNIIVDDDLSGELLELACAPPKKKKKPIPSASAFTSTAQHNFPRPAAKPLTHRQSGGRSSLPAGMMPPTPATSAAAQSSNGRTDNARYDPYSTPLQNLASSLPSQEMQQILFSTFFNDPFLTEGISLLQPQYMDNLKGVLDKKGTRYQLGDATTLANTFAFLATALRMLPDETGRLLLASQVFTGSAPFQFPRSLSKIIACQGASASDVTPLDQRYLDLALIAAQIAEQQDPPSVMLVMLKLVLYRFCMIGHRKDKIVLAGMWLAQAVKVAQALGMGKEWEGLTQGERELRRRVMWSLYVADRHHSFETYFPYTIMDAHQGIHLPSPMAESDLYKLRPDIRELPGHATEVAPTACTALFIHTHLARRITPILDSFATISAANTPHDLVLRFDASLDAFQDALPPYFRLFPLTETRFDSSHPYLPAHRIRLHATLLAYRLGVHRTHLSTYLMPSTSSAIRQAIAEVCLSSIRVQRSAKLLDSKVSFRLFNPMTLFENASTLALIMYVEKAINTSPLDGNQNSYYVRESLMWRNGIAEAAELLDNVVAGEGQTYARKSVGLLRELILRIDTPLKPTPMERDISNSPGTRSIPSFENGLPAHRNSPSIREKSFSTSPLSNDKHHAPSLSPIKPPSTSQAQNQETPYVQNVITWLYDLRKGGINLEILLKEPEWHGGWERIVVGM
ncbi:uncharacterized protein IL334_002457 [Kwoniella shivajii]|uniref:Zn(2)-C6 fungal-type domain-containing protein n=1 Tax=Kwoniella shivajii TaxID=564305 RepID=A0ABZ1CUS5_9TREE|nr:hypothetical protein IL334_002457 [Kwoniella shivajii]